jgi:hypothetical protein
MPMYNGQLDFALRTINLYRTIESKGIITTENEFTSILGTILNVLVSWYSLENEKHKGDYVWNTVLKNLEEQSGKLPHFSNENGHNSRNNLKAYLRNMRNALAHRTRENFIDKPQYWEVKIDGNTKTIPINDQIYEIEISSEERRNTIKEPIAFKIEDLKIILGLIEEAIEKAYQRLAA